MAQKVYIHIIINRIGYYRIIKTIIPTINRHHRRQQQRQQHRWPLRRMMNKQVSHFNGFFFSSLWTGYWWPETKYAQSCFSHHFVFFISNVDEPTINQTTCNVVDGIDLDEIKEFAKAFKLRRLSLGLTQTQVGQALSVTEGPAYSQSAICRLVFQFSSLFFYNLFVEEPLPWKRGKKKLFFSFSNQRAEIRQSGSLLFIALWKQKKFVNWAKLFFFNFGFSFLYSIFFFQFNQSNLIGQKQLRKFSIVFSNVVKKSETASKIYEWIELVAPGHLLSYCVSLPRFIFLHSKSFSFSSMNPTNVLDKSNTNHNR